MQQQLRWRWSNSWGRWRHLTLAKPRKAETQDLLGKAALVSALGSYTGEGINTAIEYAQIAARVLKAEKEGQPTECQEWKVEVLAPIVSSDNPTNLIMKYNGLFSISEEGDLVGGGDGTLSGTGYIKTGDCPSGVTYPVEGSFSFLVDGNLRDVNGVTSFQFSTLTGTPLNVTVNAACGDSSQLALDEIKGMIAAGIGRLPEPMRQVKAQDGASTVLPLEPAGDLFLGHEKHCDTSGRVPFQGGFMLMACRTSPWATSWISRLGRYELIQISI